MPWITLPASIDEALLQPGDVVGRPALDIGDLHPGVDVVLGGIDVAVAHGGGGGHGDVERQLQEGDDRIPAQVGDTSGPRGDFIQSGSR